MIEKMRKYIIRQQFNPSFLGIFINPFYSVRRELYKNISKISKNISGNILDVGCGSKPYQKLFINTKKYTGIEFDSQENRKKSNAEIFYDGKHFPFEDSTFDSIIFTEVLEHIFNPDEFLEEVNRVLKDNGNILLTVPFVWDEHSQPFDYGRYSSFGLRHLMDKHGFKIIESYKTLNDIRIVFQLINCYIYKKLPTNNYHIRLLFYIVLISPFTILGIIFSWILPKNNDLYMDNIIFAKKI